MNENSQICKYISKNKDTWRKDLEDMKIKVKQEGNLAVFNYSIDADFTNPLVKEARGIIIDLTDLETVCWAFNKFGNWNEGYADDIDWKSARVLEKLDGSIIKLYYYQNKWFWATNSTITADNAEINEETHRTFLDIIKRAKNYENINKYALDKNNTYIFELTSPENHIVVNYKEYKLWHLGTRNNIIGQEIEEDIGIDKPNVYYLQSFNECMDYINELNRYGVVEHEGFVVVDKDYHRIKIKTPEYLLLHHLVNISKEKVLGYIRQHLIDNLYMRLQDASDLAIQVHYYRFKYEELRYNITNFIIYVRNLYEECYHDRAAVAHAIKEEELKYFGFKAIDKPTATADELLLELRDAQIAKYIDDYRRKE